MGDKKFAGKKRAKMVNDTKRSPEIQTPHQKADISL
jgi:hypothetical protein